MTHSFESITKVLMEGTNIVSTKLGFWDLKSCISRNFWEFFCGLSSFIKRIVYSYWRHLTQTRAHIFHTMTFWSLFVTIIYYNLPNFCLVIRSLSARACPLTLTNKMCMMPVHTTRLNLRPSIFYILLYLFSIIEGLSSFQNVFKKNSSVTRDCKPI